MDRTNGSLTGGDQDEGCSSVDNTSSGREDGSRTVLDGLIDTPVEIGGGGRRFGAVQFRVSMEILELELSDHMCLHGRNRSSELSGVGATERQLAILVWFRGRGLKRDGNNVGWDGSLAEEVVRDCGDGGICVWRQGANRQVDGSDP